MASPSDKEQTEVTALYIGPSSTKTFAHTLPSSSTQNTKEKTEYLSALRKSVILLQAEVNEYLTARMEDDKATTGSSGQAVDEQKQEQNYGEEVEGNA